jgi:hypothetical protein
LQGEFLKKKEHFQRGSHFSLLKLDSMNIVNKKHPKVFLQNSEVRLGERKQPEYSADHMRRKR